MDRLLLLHRRLRRLLLARRRPLAALAAALAVLAGLQAAAPAAPATRTVLTADRDLPAGSVLGRRDVSTATFLPDSVPVGAVAGTAEVLGRTTAGPVRKGEPLTDVRLVSGSLLDGYAGAVAAPVRIGDAASVDLLRVGDRIDVIAADPQGRAAARVVAHAAPVIALPRARALGAGPGSQGALVVLAVDHATAADLASAGVVSYLSLVIRR
jgi:Flp pilus assembly protein CpaB